MRRPRRYNVRSLLSLDDTHTTIVFAICHLPSRREVGTIQANQTCSALLLCRVAVLLFCSFPLRSTVSIVLNAINCPLLRRYVIPYVFFESKLTDVQVEIRHAQTLVLSSTRRTLSLRFFLPCIVIFRTFFGVATLRVPRGNTNIVGDKRNKRYLQEERNPWKKGKKREKRGRERES